MPLLVSSEETSQGKARQLRQLLPFPRHSCLLPGTCACADCAAGMRVAGRGCGMRFLRMRNLQKQVRTKNSLSLVSEVNCLENCSMNAEHGSLCLFFRSALMCLLTARETTHTLKHSFSLPLVHAGICLTVFFFVLLREALKLEY